MKEINALIQAEIANIAFIIILIGISFILHAVFFYGIKDPEHKKLFNTIYKALYVFFLLACILAISNSAFIIFTLT